MTQNTAYEQAYNNGFEAGKQAAVASLRKLQELPEEMRARAIAVVNATNTEDMVEVVRCKDCKHFDPCIGKYTDGFGWCDDFLANYKPDDFCSYGERRDSVGKE